MVESRLEGADTGLVLFQKPQPGEHHVAGRAVAVRLDLGADEAGKMLPEGDGGAIGHGHF